MKALFCGVSCVAAAAVFAAESVVATVDVTAVDSGLENTVVAVSMLDLASGGEMVVSNLVKTTNLTVGDKLYAFDNGKYECWTLSSSKVWEKAEKTFTVSASGVLTDSEGVDASLVTIPVGRGIWLYRQNTSVPFYIYGAHTDEKTSVVPSGVSAALIGNPTQSKKAPNQIVGCVAGDQIALPSSGPLVRYTFNGTAWVSWASGVRREGFPEISAGTGFWYIPKESQTVSIVW